MDCKDESSIIFGKDALQSTLVLKRKRESDEVSTAESCESNCDESLSKGSVTSNESCQAINCNYRTGSCQSADGDYLELYKRTKYAAEKVKGSVQYEQFSADVLKLSGENSSCYFKSAPPTRVMFNDHGEWKDFPEPANATLCECFKQRRTSAKILIDQRRYSVNFLKMMQLNIETGYIRPIAWIDVNNKCFFPSKCVEGVGNRLLSEFLDTSDHQTWFSEVDTKSPPRISDCYKDGLISSGKDFPNSPTVQTLSGPRKSSDKTLHSGSAAEQCSHDFALLGDKIVKVDESNPDSRRIKNMFFAGLGMLAPYTTVTNIYKDCHKSTSGLSRLQAFIRQEEITKNARGDANIKYAWHGTSKQGVSGIVLHGFGQPRIPKNGALYGVGVYLAPEDYSHVSAVYSDVDENGEQHMVLCRTIMGKVEQVPHGSEQFHPSSEEYDTGVDDICNPKRYIIWSTHMNTHILPEYIISFKISSPWHEIIAALRGNGKKVLSAAGLRLDSQLGGQNTNIKVTDKPRMDVNQLSAPSRAPRSPWMSFPMLFLVMKSKLSAEKMAELQQYYLHFKAGRLQRDQLIRAVRCIAGDRLLADSIKSMQAQEKANERVPGPGWGHGQEPKKEENT